MRIKHLIFMLLISMSILIGGCKTAETNENAGGKNIAGNEQVSNKVTDWNVEKEDDNGSTSNGTGTINAENSTGNNANNAVNNSSEENTVKDDGNLQPDDNYVYENPYLYNDEYDDEEKLDLYWKLDRNAVALATNVCKEFASMYWEDIAISEDYESHRLNFTEEEKQSFLYLVHAAVNGGSIEALAVIALTEDNPEGKISRVVYRTNGKEWKNEAYGFGNEEIADAYTNILWQEAFA